MGSAVTRRLTAKKQKISRKKKIDISEGTVSEVGQKRNEWAGGQLVSRPDLRSLGETRDYAYSRKVLGHPGGLESAQEKVCIKLKSSRKSNKRELQKQQ